MIMGQFMVSSLEPVDACVVSVVGPDEVRQLCRFHSAHPWQCGNSATSPQSSCQCFACTSSCQVWTGDLQRPG
ncbi:hypothetical protein CRENBAI_000531 [Crenichthys baileyi]|uniref:Uncharacterized protein n=1 Tax=Crenichthys baileyi TaxID=28760 RepID=A0AAV9S667_9TELE